MVQANRPSIRDLIKELQHIDRVLPPNGPPLPPSPPSATYEGMDPWQSSVESRLGQLHGSVEKLSERMDSNFKWLLGAYGVGFVVLAGMMISGYLLLADKIGHLAH